VKNGRQILAIILSLAILAVFWVLHELLPDRQTVQAARHFDFLFAAATGIHVVALLLFRPSGRAGAWIRRVVPLTSVVLIVIVAWELLTVKSGTLPLPYFPSLESVVSVFFTDWETLGVSILHSLRLLFIGYFIGLVFGIPLGIFMGWSPRWNYWVSPFLRFIGPIPATAWIPVAMAVFPTSFTASIFLIAVACFFPITIMTWSGIANVSKSYYEIARTLGATPFYLIRKVAVPAALPGIFVGLFMGLGVAFVTLVVGELLGVKAGLGWYMNWAQGWAEYNKVYAALFVMAVMFSGIITLLFKLKDRVLVWQRGLIRW
jgi:NitT/TauT family transport system permease protein